MFKYMKLRTKLFIGFGVLIILMIVLTGFSFENIISITNMYDQSEELNQTQKKLLEIKNAHYLWMSDVKDFLYRKDITELKVQLDGTQCVLGQFIYSDDLDKEIGRFPQIMKLVEEMKQPHLDLHSSAEKIENTIKNSYEEAQEVFYSETIVTMESVRFYLDKIIEEIEKEKTNIRQLIEEENRMNILLMITVAGIIFIVSIFIAFFISRSVTKTLGGEPYFLAKIVNKVSQGVLEIKKNKGKKRGLYYDITLMVESLKKKSQLIDKIAKGKLDVEVQLASDEDEVGHSLKNMIRSLREKSDLINEISKGNLTVEVELASGEDEIGISLISMVKSLREIVNNIRIASDEIRNGAEQLSSSSQSLSDGSTQQAASIEQISASLSEISSQIQENTENAVNAGNEAQETKINAEKSNERMKELVFAMNEINQSAQDIKNITKVIDDIAFQINLLALNADIEAARVGKYGKGFAVVASSVRDLATESGSSVSESAELVEKAISNINKVNHLVSITAEQLEDIVNRTDMMNNRVNEVAEASQEQSRGIEQISTALNQVEDVVQSNSANSEENASTSEELNNQARRLIETISSFKMEHNQNLLTE